MIPYEDDDDAVRIANDTAYGLSGYISGDTDRARAMARRIRTGNVHLNGAPGDIERAVRRLQAVRQRPRVGRAWAWRSSSRPRPSSATAPDRTAVVAAAG